MPPDLRWKTRAFAIFVILSNSFGNLCIALGMRSSEDVGHSPAAFLAAIFNPWVFFGILLLISWLLTRMAMMSWADLTYVLPVTSFGYVVSAVLGYLFLNEQLTGWRWGGTLLIVVGTVLVGVGNPHQEKKA